jgi:hypothetical protein
MRSGLCHAALHTTRGTLTVTPGPAGDDSSCALSFDESPQACGRMFWFWLNRLVGSYFDFSAASRE